MLRIDLLNYSEFGKVRDLETLLTNNPLDKPSLAAAIFKCIEAKDFTQDHIKTIKLLLSHGAEVNTKDNKFQTFLMLGCAKGNIELVKTLLACGSNPKEVDRQQRTTIMLALNNTTSDPIEIVKLLHERDVDINAKDLSGSTALHIAAMNGHKDSLEYLISNDAKIDAQDTNNDTPLHLAFKRDRKQCIDILMQCANRTLKNMQGRLPMDEAHGKSLALVSSKKYNKDEMWDNRRSRGKPRGKNFKKKEKEPGECSKCKILADVFCLDCASVMIKNLNEDYESVDRKNFLETKESLRLANLKIDELEKVGV